MKMRPPAPTIPALLLVLAASPAVAQVPEPPPTEVPGLAYPGELLPEADHDPAIPTPESLLGFPLGSKAASPEEIARALESWAEASARARLNEYARSFEDRPLFNLVITAPENLERIDEIRAGLARLADPRGLSVEEGKRLVESLPAVAWLAYSIHGNESSGSDASLAVIYHLLAGRSPEVKELLRELVVVVDPMMNPDGRHRFVKGVAEHRAVSPNLDDQSLLHTEYWPYGRMNHYLFDLNRDWILGVNPESRGRIREAASWHPMLFVDAHEMGAQDTYLFSPARSPRNPNRPPRADHWSAVFARDQAAAFDRQLWPYYTGEWNEGWYPGYSDAWAEYRGAVGILYEQASVTEGGVRRPDGSILTYREAVHHQATSSLANLETLRQNADELLADFLADRRRSVSADGPWANRTFALLPTGNQGRLARFLDLMELQGIEVYRAEEEFSAGTGTDQLGRTFRQRRIPAGTLLIPNRQPEARLAATMLRFDEPMPPDYTERERLSILRRGRSTIYDVTAWNLTMLYGLDALTLDAPLPRGVERVKTLPTPEAVTGPGVLGFVIDGADDRSVVAAARLMERGLQVRVAERDFDFGHGEWPRGSVVLTRHDNPETDLREMVARTCGELGLRAHGLERGLGEGDLPDLGGGHFQRLEPPRIALLARGGISAYDFGSIWFLLDQHFGIRHSHLDEDALDFMDLRRYNVLVAPDRWFSELDEGAKKGLGTWIEAGGTLIAIDGNAREVIQEEASLSRVRDLPAVLDKLDEYELAVLREWLAATRQTPAAATLWSHSVAPELSHPWDALADAPRPAKEELERRDQWQRLFMPQGVFLAGRVDDRHWLTFGAADGLPILTGSGPVLMAAPPVEAPVRYGVHEGASGETASEELQRLGWAPLPAGQELFLRMSGLLWPEAAHRLAGSAYLTREGKGRGQIILFAHPPVFRGATLGTARLLANAMIYGPSFGASPVIEP